MAVNVQKFLPSSKSVALAKITNTIAKRSSVSISISEKSQENLEVIKVKSIEIDKLLKGTLASEKKKLDDKKKKDTQKRRDDVEQRLEKKPSSEKGSIKMPSLPRMGFLDWIKNFIGNIILGYFAVRLVDHLPKLIPIAKLIGKATDFAIDLGGKLLDGLATFIDVGYKAVDATRNLVGNTFGEDALKNFDLLTSEFEKFMNIAIIVGMASADFGMNRLKGKGTEKAAGTVGRRGIGRAATRSATRVGGKGAGKLTSKIGAKALKAIPLLGAGLSIAEGIMRIREGDYVGGLLSFGTAIPVAGWAFLALDVAREFMGGKEFDKSVGKAFGGTPGLTDKQVQKRTPSMSGPSFMGLAGGGVTRGGKTQKRPSRTIRKGRKGKYKRVVPKKPGEVEITSPGSDVGGEDKIFGLFPNPLKMAQNAIDMMNPFKVIQKAGENLGDSDYFGPILAITSKILLGQKPSQSDYKNVGLGINLLISKGIDDGKIKGGLAAAFAGGGFVDPSTLNAISEGGDISDWVASSFKEATETNAQKTLREIQNNLRLKKEGEGPSAEKKVSEEEMPVGTGSLVGNTNAEKVFNFLKGSGFTDEAAAGVIGNLMQESGVNPKSRQLGGGPGRGIMQWGTGAGSGGRWDALVAWASSSGKDPWALDTQVEWMMKEMRSYGTYNRLKGVTDIKKAVEIFEKEMEKAGVPNYPRRYQYAADALASFGKGRSTRGAIGSFDSMQYEGPIGSITTVSGIQDQQGRPVKFASPAADAFKRMMQDASRQGVIFKPFDIASTYRTPEYNRKIGGALRSLHTKGLAADIHGTTGSWIRRNGAKYGWYPNDYPGTHGGHYEFKGISSMKPKFHGGIGFVSKDGLTLKLHKGEMYKVVDKDSVDLFGKELVQDIINIENKSQLITKAPSIIEKLKAISGYTSYESDSEQTIVIMEPPVNVIAAGGEGGESSTAVLFAGAEEEDPFDFLYASS